MVAHCFFVSGCLFPDVQVTSFSSCLARLLLLVSSSLPRSSLSVAAVLVMAVCPWSRLAVGSQVARMTVIDVQVFNSFHTETLEPHTGTIPMHCMHFTLDMQLNSICNMFDGRFGKAKLCQYMGTGCCFYMKRHLCRCVLCTLRLFVIHKFITI